MSLVCLPYAPELNSAGSDETSKRGRLQPAHLSGSLTLGLLAFTALVAVSVSSAAAQQTFADWKSAPASGDLNSAGNWTQGFVPTDGFFQASSVTALTDSSQTTTTFNQLHFQSGATAYTLANSAGFIFAGAGIVVDANAGTFTLANLGVVTFQNASTIQNNNTAGSVVINNTTGSVTRFIGTSSAGNGTINNRAGAAPGTTGGRTVFNTGTSAASATISNFGATFAGATAAGTTTFNTGSTAGAATITNNGPTAPGTVGGSTTFNDDGTGTVRTTAGTSSITNNGGGFTTFNGSSVAGASTLTNSGASVAGTTGGTTTFNNSTSAGTATINNAGATGTGTSGGSTTFNTGTSAGGSTLINTGASVAGATAAGTTTFNTGSAAGTATISNFGATGSGTAGGSTTFNDDGTGTIRTTAGNATINNGFAFTSATGGIGGRTIFNASTSAGSATINNSGALASGANAGGATTFNTGSSAGNATITNSAAAGFGLAGGMTTFNDDGTGTTRTTAGSAVIHTSGTGAQTIFNGASTAGGATLDTKAGGIITFNGTSTAGNSSIKNGADDGGTGTAGSVVFNGTSTAGTATVSNFNNGSVTFQGNSSADHAIIRNGSDTTSGNGTTGGSILFTDNADAANATITGISGGSVTFNGNSKASSATINTDKNSSLIFAGASTAGSANITANGLLDITGVTASNFSIGSLASGSGAKVSLGNKNLIIGGNNTDSSYGGAFQGTQSGQSGTLVAGSGTVIKIGSGTLTLGDNGQGLYQNLTLGAGVVAVNNDANLGVRSGTGFVAPTVTFAGGTLRITNSGITIFNRATQVLGGANAIFDLQGTLNGTTWAGAINGAGGLSVTGASGNALILTGTNGYQGATTVASGLGLIVQNGGSITSSSALNNSGTVQILSGGSATFGSVTNAPMGKIAVNVGGTWTDDLTNAGTFQNDGAFVGNVASNTGTLTNTGSISGTVNTAGTFTNAAGGTVAGLVTNSGTGSNAGALNGGLTNTAGIFTNTGTIAGPVTVSGGTLTGSGAINLLTIASGASFAPGDGVTPGTSTTITGSLAFASGALYVVALNPTTSTTANVSGLALLGGATVNATYANGIYVAKRYTILTATGGVSGTFSGPVNTNLPANFAASLNYDPTHAFLDLALNFVPTFAPLNINQANVAATLTKFFNTTGGIPLAFGTLSPAGLTQASGPAPTGSQQATFDAMTQFLGVLTDPFVAGRGDGLSAGGTSPMRYAADDDEALAYARKQSATDAFAGMVTKAPPLAFQQRWSVWAAGYGGSQTTDGNATLGSNRTTSSVYGTAVGADYRFSPDTLAGFALAGGGTNFSIANALGGGRSDLFQAGAFVRHGEGAAYISAAAAYGWQDTTTNRTVTAAGFDQLQGRFTSNTYSGRIEGGYRFVSPLLGWGLTPYAAGQAIAYDLPAYTEVSTVGGPGTFALGYASRTVTASRSELGLRSDKSFLVTDGLFTLRGRLAWAHNFDTDRGINATFLTLPGTAFTVNGAMPAQNSALATAAAEMKWRNGWSAAATFEGEFSDVTRSYAGKGVVRYAW